MLLKSDWSRVEFDCSAERRSCFQINQTKICHYQTQQMRPIKFHLWQMSQTI